MDEPSNWELARQLADIKQMLANVVGHPEYGADKRALDYRFTEQRADIEEVRRQHAEDIRAVNDRITAQAKAGVEHRMHWRSLIWQGALPALVALLSVLATLWIAHHGGGSGH